MKRFLLLLLLAVTAACGLPAVAAPAIVAPSTDRGAPASLRAVWILDPAALRALGIERPTRLAFDSEGRLLVLDGASGRVVALDENGRRLHELGGYGEGEGALRLPIDLAADRSGGVLILDRGTGSILAYDSAGRFLGSRPLDDAMLESARDPGARLLLDPFGTLWLLAARDRDLVPLTERLAPARAGRFLVPEESIREPRLAAFLPGGHAWIYDEAASALLGFGSGGRLRATIPLADSLGGAEPTDLATDPSGSLYLADRRGQRILVLDAAGAVRFELLLGGPTIAWRPGALAYGRGGRIAVADPDRREIRMLAVERDRATP